jgi:hypothetical protein
MAYGREFVNRNFSIATLHGTIEPGATRISLEQEAGLAHHLASRCLTPDKYDHACRVAKQFDYDEEGNQPQLEPMIVAILHDICEDSFADEGWLLHNGIEPGRVAAVVALTRIAGENYATDYLPRVKANPLALKVKLADLRDNMRLERISAHPDGISLAKRYIEAYRFLTS